MSGLYIHIPFCKKKCPYCDFISFDNKTYLIDEYIDALYKELLLYINQNNFNFETLYIGGGTPSFLSLKQIKRLFDLLYSVINKEKLREITIEVNPGTIDKSKAEVISENVNRVSLGMQSFNNNTLKILGRIHKSRENYLTFEIFKKAGINNINIDLMYGICDQNINDVLDDLKKTIKLNPEHISFYLFTIHEKKFKGKKLPDDDLIADMYFKGIKKLRKHGFVHYEISNFAKKNYFCQHNMNYWNLNEYLGVGVSASSFINNKRFTNTKNLKYYLKSINNNKLPVVYKENITYQTKIKEYIMLKLRTKDGIDNENFHTNFKFDFYVRYSNIIGKLVSEKYMKISGNRIALTEKGFLMSNEIINKFF